ncbi:MAG: flavodoxin family protein [bacterium]|nr:flavodoxin family protein [bacterium]
MIVHDIMVDVIIIFASTGGNTELVCATVAEILEGRGISTIVQRVERSQVDDVDKGKIILLAAPTYEHGVIEYNFQPFLKELAKKDLKGKPFAAIGLGDTKYDDHYHIESANVLTQALKKAKGSTLVHALRINKSPLPQLETVVREWTLHLAKKITESI